MWDTIGLNGNAFPLTVVSNTLSSPSGQRFTALLGTWGPDAELFCDIVSPQGVGLEIALYTRVTDPGTANYDGYFLLIVRTNATDYTWGIYKAINGTTSPIVALAPGPALAVNDAIWFSTEGTTLKGYHRSGLGGYTEIVSGTDSALTSAGALAVFCGDNIVRLDNLGGGTMTHTPPTAKTATDSVEVTEDSDAAVLNPDAIIDNFNRADQNPAGTSSSAQGDWLTGDIINSTNTLRVISNRLGGTSANQSAVFGPTYGPDKQVIFEIAVLQTEGVEIGLYSRFVRISESNYSALALVIARGTGDDADVFTWRWYYRDPDLGSLIAIGAGVTTLMGPGDKVKMVFAGGFMSAYLKRVEDVDYGLIVEREDVRQVAAGRVACLLGDTTVRLDNMAVATLATPNPEEVFADDSFEVDDIYIESQRIDTAPDIVISESAVLEMFGGGSTHAQRRGRYYSLPYRRIVR